MPTIEIASFTSEYECCICIRSGIYSYPLKTFLIKNTESLRVVYAVAFRAMQTDYVDDAV